MKPSTGSTSGTSACFAGAYPQRNAGRGADAGDLFRALDGLKDYDGKQDVRAWLFTVARNAYYDYCRRAKHAAPLEDAETKAADSPDIAQLLVDKDAAFTVHQCLHALEEPYKEVFSLRVFGELPFDRIGAIFGHNAAWARVTYYRAKTRLQTMLEQRK